MESRIDWVGWLQIYGGIAFGLALLGYFLWHTDLPELGRVMGQVRWGWLALSVAAVMVHYLSHGWRWKILLHKVAPTLDLRTVWHATTILWAFNTLLPLRAGNLLRPAVVALSYDVPYTTLLFSLVAETVCEVFGLVVLVLATLLFLPGSVASSPAVGPIREIGAATLLVTLAGLGLVVLLSTNRARSAMEAAVGPIPSERVRARLLLLFDQLVEGMAAVGDFRQMAEALLMTGVVWGSWLLSIVAALQAFSLDLPVAASMFIESALTVATMVPQAPGLLGMFQVVVDQTLILFGAPEVESRAVALVLWIVCFVPITALGMWDAWRMGLGITPAARQRMFRQLTGEADDRVHPPPAT